MLPTRAANRDRQIAAVRLEQFWNPVFEKMRNVLEHLVDQCVPLQIFDDLRVTTGQPCQSRLPIGIGEAAHVKNKICVSRHALSISERLEQDRHPPLYAIADSLTNQFPQFVNARSSRIDDQIGRIGNRLEQGTFLVNGLREAESV